MCLNANKSAIRACRLHENARKKLAGDGGEPSRSIFFSILLGTCLNNHLPLTATWSFFTRLMARDLHHRGQIAVLARQLGRCLTARVSCSRVSCSLDASWSNKLGRCDCE